MGHNIPAADEAYTIDSGELTVKSVQLALRIPDTTKRND
jgi:hypothetical protein